MKKTLLASLLAAALALPAASQAAEKTYELAFTSEGYRDNHVVTVNVWKPWIEEVKKKSNGRLNIVFYSPGSLCTGKEVPDAVKKGRVDIGHSLPGANPGMFGYCDPGDANLSVNNALAASVAMFNYVKKYDWVRKELDNDKFHLLSVWANSPLMICSKDPITKLADIKGKIFNYHITGADSILKELGAVPVLVMPPDIYMSMQRNQTNASIMGLSILKPFKLYEVFSNVLNYPLSPGYHYLVMNKASWDALPADLQKILTETTGEVMCKKVGKTLDDGGNDSLKWTLENNKCKLNELSADEKAKLAAVLGKYKDAWVEKRKKAGYDRAAEAISLFAKEIEAANAQYK